MALSGSIGAQRDTIPGGGVFCRQARPSVTFRKGAIACIRAGSNLAEIPLAASPRADLVAYGVIRAPNAFTSDSTTDSAGGAVDANGNPENVTIDSGVKGWFATGNGANQVTAAMQGQIAYVYDDDTIYATNLNGQLSAVVYVDSVRDDGRVAVRFDPPRTGQIGALTSADDLSENAARFVFTSLGANTGTGTGTLTITATGALAAQDGITPEAGDIAFIQEGTTNLAAATDAGPWEVVNPGDTGVSPVLRRPSWYRKGDLIGLARKIKIGGGGTKYAGSTWRSDALKGAKIDTDAPVFWPERLVRGVTLASGTLSAAITDMPVKGTTLTNIDISSTPTVAPHANTRVWRVSALTSGVAGTASIQIVAESAPGTTNASDVGTYTVIVEQ